MRGERLAALLAGVGALCVLGALYVYGRRRRELRGNEDADVTSELQEAAKEAAGVKVLNRELPAGDEVRAELLWLLDRYESDPAAPTHAVRIRERSKYFPSGSVRWTEDEQAQAAAAGLSAAVKPNDSAHGPMRRAGLDVQPADFNPNKSFTEQPGQFEKCEAFALWAEAQQHPNGTRFKSGKNFPITAPDGVKGDWVHVEIEGWAKLPLLSPQKPGSARGVET